MRYLFDRNFPELNFWNEEYLRRLAVILLMDKLPAEYFLANERREAVSSRQARPEKAQLNLPLWAMKLPKRKFIEKEKHS
jgi:hypothetical protein